jgi:adenylate cyclase
MEADGSGTLTQFKLLRTEVIEPKISQFQGHIVGSAGDSLLIEFASAVNAVQCAVETQKELAARNASLPEDRRMAFRMGVNLGDVIAEDDTIHGDGVNVAARLEKLAEPGGVCIGRSVHDQVKGRLPYAYADLGEQQLHNIADPVRAFRVTSSGPMADASPARTGNAALTLYDKLSIAVLPFTNLSGDPKQEYFSDGITEDIITDLSRWHELSVLSRSASFRYRGADVDLSRIARDLHVRYIVEGSVRRLGERIRIAAQLIDTETGSHVWGDRFDRELPDVFKVQDEVVQTIVSTLVGRAQAADVERVRRKPPASLAAYECVLQGNALSWDDAKDAAEATRLFENAIEIDPDYGLAHALLAVMRFKQWQNDLGGSDDAALNESYRLAKRAVELAVNESTCFAILGQVCLRRRSFDLALQHMQRATEINPANQWNAADMGEVLAHVGRAEEAIAWFKRARQIDPYFDPSWYWHSLGKTHMVLGRYEEAVNEFERASKRPYQISAYLAGCHARLGASGRARVLAAECLERRPDFTISRWMAKQYFKDPADLARLVECLRAAGLPE